MILDIYIYRDQTWNQDHATYIVDPIEFNGAGVGASSFLHIFPTFLQLWELFWPSTLLSSIVRETNRYATTPMGDGGRTMGGPQWKPFTISELKAFFAIHLYMGMKAQPNLKSYWQKAGSIFHCPIISDIMSRDRFTQLRRCFHVTNPQTYAHIGRGDVEYDKMRQTRQLINHIRNAFRIQWNLGKMVTVDEMMVQYKGTYCPVRQYMPKKPCKWGIKIWCLADSTSKYVYNFDVYCGRTIEAHVRVPLRHGDPSLAQEVVLNLVEDLHGKGHVITMDNYFTSIPLYMELLFRGIYASGTVRLNRIGLPTALINTKRFRRCQQGHLEWLMHQDREICCVMWKDKCPVLLLSTHATPIVLPGA